MTTSTLIRSTDGVQVHVIDTGGAGVPLLFLHEYCGDQQSWSGQISDLAGEHRCIVPAARGYLPSDVPTEADAYSWEQAVRDAIAVLDARDIESAHVIGVSMGGYTAVQLGRLHPDRVRSVAAVSVGSGSDPVTRGAFIREAEDISSRLRSDGTGPVGVLMSQGPGRLQLRRHDEAAWQLMVDQFIAHSATGLAHTMLQIQGRRPSLHDQADDLRTYRVPLLIIAGDEDEACLSTGLMLKRTVPTSALRILPHSGHVPNLEDPVTFNRIVREFVLTVETGAWPDRDPRTLSASPFGLDRAPSPR